MEILIFFGSRISLGFGDHHKIGSSSEYHGNIPLLYASKSLSGLRSPPIHRRPLGSARLAGGNSSLFDNLNTGI